MSSTLKAILAKVYPEVEAGGFTRYDGTVEFYGRINSLLEPDMHVLDLGAGRGCQLENTNKLSFDLLTIQGKVAKLSGVDVDSAVLDNPSLDEAKVYDGKTLPYDADSFDLIFSDWVLEHIDDPEAFASEIFRVMKPGGWFCARTPSTMSLVALAGRLVPNRFHAKVISAVQEGGRTSIDVFPTRYRLNSFSQVRKHFPSNLWKNCTYGYSAEPAYHFNKSQIARLMALLQYLKRPFGAENLYVFLQKR